MSLGALLRLRDGHIDYLEHITVPGGTVRLRDGHI